MASKGKERKQQSRRFKPPILSWRFSAAPSKQPKLQSPQSGQSLEPIANHSNPHDAIQTALIRQLEQPDIREITASLDPFCNLPFSLTPDDRSLLHSYLLQVPARVYGTRSDTVFSAVRDVSFQISLTSSLTLYWMLVAARGLFTNTSDGLEQISLIGRKHRAYRLLNNCIRQSGGRISDEVLGGIIMAAITEARLSDPKASHAHLHGYEAAIRARGGLRTSLEACSISALRLAHLMPYLVCEPLQVGGDSKVHMEQFVQFLTSEMRHRGFSPLPSEVSPEAGLLQFQSMMIGPALTNGVLGVYLWPQERHVVRYVDEASSFLALFLITLTLWRASESFSNAQLFATQLRMVLNNSAAFDAQTGNPLLTMQGFMWVVIKAIQDFQAILQFRPDDGLWPIMHGADALLIFRTLTRQSRYQARLLLFQILSGQKLN
ncbi:hypothetical protein BJX99DRAFT_57326 [Aspergillus californicus]